MFKRVTGIVLVVVFGSPWAVAQTPGPKAKQQSFPSPRAAVDALLTHAAILATR